jgi:hypothetical protein
MSQEGQNKPPKFLIAFLVVKVVFLVVIGFLVYSYV